MKCSNLIRPLVGEQWAVVARRRSSCLFLCRLYTLRGCSRGVRFFSCKFALADLFAKLALEQSAEHLLKKSGLDSEVRAVHQYFIEISDKTVS